MCCHLLFIEQFLRHLKKINWILRLNSTYRSYFEQKYTVYTQSKRKRRHRGWEILCCRPSSPHPFFFSLPLSVISANPIDLFYQFNILLISCSLSHNPPVWFVYVSFVLIPFSKLPCCFLSEGSSSNSVLLIKNETLTQRAGFIFLYTSYYLSVPLIQLKDEDTTVPLIGLIGHFVTTCRSRFTFCDESDVKK